MTKGTNHILPFEKLEATNVWFSCLKNDSLESLDWPISYSTDNWSSKCNLNVMKSTNVKYAANGVKHESLHTFIWLIHFPCLDFPSCCGESLVTSHPISQIDPWKTLQLFMQVALIYSMTLQILTSFFFSYRCPHPPLSQYPSPWKTRNCCPFIPLRASHTSLAWQTPLMCSLAACRGTNRLASSSPEGRVSSWRHTSWCSLGTRCPAFLPLLTCGPKYAEKTLCTFCLHEKSEHAFVLMYNNR